jgi:hypothetical protein
LDWMACPRPTPGIEVNRVADGYVVYDPERDRVHYLNPTAVLLFELCDGRRRAADLPRLLQSVYALPEPPLTEVAAYLEKLLAEGLIY